MWHLQSGGLSANLLLRGGQSFSLLRPPTDWMKPTHIREDSWLYSKIWMLTLSKNTFQQHLEWYLIKYLDTST